MIVVEGIIKEIVFRNEDNGYTVAKIETEGELITIVGNAAIINEDELVEVEGEWVYHDKFGEQIEFKSIKSITPSTLEGIEKYLASGLLPYVGPKTAKEIVKKFGEKSLEIIQYNPEKLKEISGIGDKKYARIAEAYEEQREIKDIMVYLQSYDISVNNSIKIYKQYGKEAISIISKNPYRLSQDIYGIGFQTSDKIARRMGIDEKSPFRIEAALKHVLSIASQEGHCFLYDHTLKNQTLKLLGIDYESVENTLSNLIMKKHIIAENSNDKIRVYNNSTYMAEQNVAKKLVALRNAEYEDLNLNIDKEIKEIEKKENINFGEKQRVAIKSSFEKGVLVITGGPGTGKTTTINAIIKIFEKLEKTVLLAAPTGRAAKRMSETSGRESQTIHRLLEYGYMDEGAAFNRDEDTPIEGDVIIIDEASMIDINLMSNLIKAIDIGTRLILVGDIDQLPSVGPGNVLKDIIASNKIPVVMLDEIFRQAEESMIVVNAHRINKGEFPRLNEKNKDFYFVNTKNKEETLKTIIELCTERLPKYYNINFEEDIQVLSPMKKGVVGTKNLNKHLQKNLNPKSKNKTEKKLGDFVYRTGDKVMQMKNNYNIEWEVYSHRLKISNGKGIFNGDFGRIEDIDLESNIARIIFDEEKIVDYEFKNFDELQLSYATTVHKSQGSEFPVVIIPIEWGPPMLLTRNLIYTAITRARSLVVLVGNIKYLNMMIKNNRITKRNSSLDDRINIYLDQLELIKGL